MTLCQGMNALKNWERPADNTCVEVRETMLFGLIAGWILGSVSLYAYLVFTAREPQHQECVECHLTQCAECPHLKASEESAPIKRAA